MVDAEHPAYDAGSCWADGHAQCRRCLAALPQTLAAAWTTARFCSAACAHEFRIRTSPAYARQAVYRRDHGICMHCRLDCGLLDRIIARLRRAAVRDRDQGQDDAAGFVVAPSRSLDGDACAVWLIEALGFGRRTRVCSLWQVDHRVPFSTGGADCGLGNLRTLCLGCHQLQTRELHRRQKALRS